MKSSRQSDYLTAPEALELLGVRRQTLYAYVSKGWIRSVPQEGSKSRLYPREDLEMLKRRSRARSGHGPVAASAMNWGEPIIPTSVVEITPEGPRYRGKLATELARAGASFEAVAELLWTGIWTDESLRWPVRRPAEGVRQAADHMPSLQSNSQLLDVFALLVLQMGMARGSSMQRLKEGRTLEAAREIIHVLTGCFGYLSPRQRFYPMRRGQAVVDGLIAALDLAPTPENREVLEAILILLADHELSPGTFAARVAASSGAVLHSCIASAICTSSGAQVGRIFAEVESFLGNAVHKTTLLRRLKRYHERGLQVPGFHHPLYPQGDPRTEVLLELARRHPARTRHLDAVLQYAEDARERYGLQPRHELAIVALTRAMGIPDWGSAALFILARTAGWVAHVQEQRLSGMLLRPRAKFTG